MLKGEIKSDNFSDLNDRIKQLRLDVWQANMALQKHKLVTFTWGNVSGIDRDSGLVAIKPSGVAYEDLKPENIVVVDLEGQRIYGDLNPSSDTDTHLELYRTFPELQSIVHTHSSYATSWAQACVSIPAMGTTHADYFYGNIPCTRPLSEDELKDQYELNTGKVIVETIKNNPPLAVPGIIVSEHGPFAWGTSPDNAVHNAVVLEEVAKMALHTLQINPARYPISQTLLDKHYLRKHGINSYYGQSN